MILVVNQQFDQAKGKTIKKEPLSLWKSIILLIIFTFGAVALFGAIVYLFIKGAEQLGLPLFVHVAIFVVVSGIFAWLLKRITDIGSDMGRYWFPEDKHDNER